MAVVHLLADSPLGHYLECDWCRKREEISLPITVFALTALMLQFDADHRFCQIRPVTRCQFADPVDGMCMHERNLTPECGPEICPLI